MNLLLLSIGGSLGAILRYYIGLLMMKRYPSSSFPFAMIVVNLLGSFGLGVFFNLNYGEIPLRAYDDPLYLFIGIGFFGAFTTFSTFSIEAMQLYRNKEWKALMMYSLISIIGSIFSFVIGFYMGK